MTAERTSIKPTGYEKVRVALEHVDDIFEKLEVAEDEAEEQRGEVSDPLTKGERAFYEAYVTHWVHAKNRKFATEYIHKLVAKALK